MVSILHVSQPTTGGVARAVLGLAAAQQAAGFDVTVACPAGALADKLTAAGLHWQRWQCERQPGRTLVEERQGLKEILGHTDPRLVHLHSSKAGLIGRLAVRGRTPTVFQPHAWSFLAAAGATRRAAVRWERYATRWTDITLFCSRQEQVDGLAHGIAGRGRVTLNGVDLDQFRPPTAAERAQARSGLSIPADARVAAVVGRRSHQKGQDIAMAAWPVVRQALPAAVLLLMGDGFDDIRDETSGIYSYAGRQDVYPAFAASDVVLAPSRWEGLSLSLLEGMATARSTVAADVAGSREALLDGPLPAAGTVIPTDDAAALAAAVVARLRDLDLVHREGVAARQRAEAEFAEEATNTSISDVYRLLLRSRDQ